MHPYIKQKKGYVLILVLGSITLLSSIVLLFSLKVTEKIKVESERNTKDFLIQKAYSALEISLGVINQYGVKDHALWGPQQGWKHPLDEFQGEFPKDMEVHVTCYDEYSKIPLTGTSRELLTLGLQRLGITLEKEDQLSDSLLDWIDADNLSRLHGLDGTDYKDDNKNLQCPNRVLHSWRELDFIHAWDNLSKSQKRHFASIFSLFNSKRLNINSITNETFEILEEYSATDLNTIINVIAGEDGILGSEDDNIIKDFDSYPQLKNSNFFKTSTDTIYIKIEVSYADSNALLHALVKWNGGSVPDTEITPNNLVYPFTILRLEENSLNFSSVEF